MRRVLITGVAGFIGSNLATRLLVRGDRVVGVDNLSQGDLLNLAGIPASAPFSFHKLDIRDRNRLQDAAKDCDAIIHLAAYKIPRYSDALDTLNINGFGSDVVARVALEVGARLIVASTSDVYGKNASVPFSEESALVVGSPEVRRWAYSISKMFEEQLLFAYRERNGLDFVILRLFGGYGPNQALSWWGGPQSVFIDAALEQRELEVHGDGTQTRSFTFITDHVCAFEKALDYSPGDGPRVFNIGSTEEVSIADLARRVWALVNSGLPPRVRFVPYSAFGRYEDVARRVPDITRARTLLGFEPTVSLNEGLRRTIEWQRGRRSDLANKPARAGAG